MQFVLNYQIRRCAPTRRTIAKEDSGVGISHNLSELIDSRNEQGRTFPINVIIYCPDGQERQLAFEYAFRINALRDGTCAASVYSPLQWFAATGTGL